MGLVARRRGEEIRPAPRPPVGHVTVHGSDGEVTAGHAPRAVGEGWSTIPSYHERLWREVLAVEHHDLVVCEEAARWN